MLNLVIAALVFAGSHAGISSSAMRVQLIASVGERMFLLLYSATALASMSWLVMAYRAAPYVPLWDGGGGRALAVLLMPLAFVLAAGSMMTRNPTAVGQQPDGDAPEPARGVLRLTRHPLMWAIGLWALVHLLANGDRASLVFFGALALLALGGTLLIDRKRTLAAAPGWGVFLQRTSNLPFAALAQGRQRLVWRELRWPLAVGLALTAVVVVLHPHLFGVAAIAWLPG